ncbi:hypothetical protein BU23DRAFT_261282 [Bimuria novae-zelandiae CBS 107.79]|uniref:Uncharacterized protein n=1 Tax=Bimuria novae-zelandiae CBS 107.79 TaxID=1447943 RepID=A0A6A5UV03_9PLEO|nr:hypothetical protein BU23DRAFT_261282 [Bimuria novae-zelandiae CBS 107.79]
MYSCAQVGAVEKKSSSSFFNNAPIHRTNYICTGTVSCTYLDSDIQAMHHTEVTASMLETIRQVRARNGRDSQEVDANSFYLSE